MPAEKTVHIAASIRAGWTALGSNLWLMLSLGLAYGLALLLGQLASAPVSLLVVPVQWIIMGVILMAAIQIVRRSGAKVEGLGDVQVEPRRMLRFLGATLVTTLMTLLGLLLLVVPGIFLALKYGFAPAFVLDSDLSLEESLRRSARLSDGVKWQLFLQGLAFAGVILLGLLALLVGVFPALMTVLLAWSWTYVDLRRQSEADELPAHAEGQGLA